MPRTLPTSVITAVNSQTTTNVFLVLLEISHSAVSTFYLVNNTENVVSGANTYIAFPFAVTLPPDDPELQVRAQGHRGERADRDLAKHLRAGGRFGKL